MIFHPISGDLVIQQNGGGRYYSPSRPEVGHIMLGHPTTPVYFVPGKNTGSNAMVGVMTGGSSAFSPLIVSQAATGKDGGKRASESGSSAKVNGKRCLVLNA